MGQKMRVICSQCGFESEDTSMEYCPICGKKIGQEDMVPVEEPEAETIDNEPEIEPEKVKKDPEHKDSKEADPADGNRERPDLWNLDKQKQSSVQAKGQQSKSYGKIAALAAMVIVIFIIGRSLGKASAESPLENGTANEASVTSQSGGVQAADGETEIVSTETVQEEAFSTEPVMIYSSAPTGNYERLTFTTASATSILEAESVEIHYEPSRAIDGDLITSWQEGSAGDGVGEELTLSFSRAEKVKYLCLYTGNWRDSERFYNNNRPATMTIVADGEEYDVSFKDGMTRWFVVFDKPVETKTVTFRINSVYKGTKSPDLCISEVFAYGGV